MAKRMLIDATHPEETRVVVLNGNRLEEFDFESSTKRHVKGNIYLAKVTRVEPSLQAAFVEYGGNRHGFLAFSEIHPDYYRIPIGDRREPAEGASAREPIAAGLADIVDEDGGAALAATLPEPAAVSEGISADDDGDDIAVPAPEWTAEESPATLTAAPADLPLPEVPPAEAGETETAEPQAEGPVTLIVAPSELAPPEVPPAEPPGTETTEPEAASPVLTVTPAELPPPEVPPAEAAETATAEPEAGSEPSASAAPFAEPWEPGPQEPEVGGPAALAAASSPAAVWAMAAPEDGLAADDEAIAEVDEIAAFAPAESDAGEPESIETLGGDELDEAERQRSRVPRHYKIQEVVKRRQIMLVQVTKEERGNKGAALTTYLSLAGRYCVLMPNTARGGGVSRKITSLSDRRRLKDILSELDIPEGMGVIVRTAGAERSKAEIRRDYEYLLRLWNEIRDLTLRSTAPALIYEEGNLIKRSIRDLYTRDIDEVLVEGEDGYRTAKAFMKMLMPSHAKRVQPYRDAQVGLLHRFQVESQIDAIHSPIVQLRSGGYVVIDQTEALVALDVNSGRSTRERNIEETALRTNLEAAEEIARQLRLRDLAGLIVIDFIDMEEHRNQVAVERRLKDALKNDRARIQVGRISAFGLLEMSRQRLRPSLVEASTEPCPHCGGTGFVRSTESTALYVLRAIEEEGMRRRSAEVSVYVPTAVALYVLNNKRASLTQLETRYGIHVLMARDDALIPPAFRLERLRALEPGEAPAPVPAALTQAPEPDDEDEEEDEEVAAAAEAGDGEPVGPGSDDERGRARRRKRRRRRHEDERVRAPVPAHGEDLEERAPAAAEGEADRDSEEDEAGRLRRRRGRRGGRRRGRHEDGAEPGLEIARAAADTIEIVTAETASADGEIVTEEAAPVNGEIEIAHASSAPDAAAGRLDPWEVELVTPALAGGIEAASLPALAGDAAPTELLASDERREPPADAPQWPPQEPRAEEAAVGNGSAAPAAFTAGWAAPSAPDDRPEVLSDTPALTPEMATQTAHALAAHAEPAHAEPAHQLPNEPAQVVQDVKEKPENPRRGWWQRLIQP